MMARPNGNDIKVESVSLKTRKIETNLIQNKMNKVIKSLKTLLLVIVLTNVTALLISLTFSTMISLISQHSFLSIWKSDGNLLVTFFVWLFLLVFYIMGLENGNEKVKNNYL
jgi:hypothetical protein